jgi:HK97 family phage prohead protease
MLERTLAFPMVDVEWREPNAEDSSGDWYTLTGHAAVFEQPTTLYKGKGFQITEEIDRTAFDAVLRTNPDVHLNVNHDMNLVMARTGIKGGGALVLTVDDVGLRVHARIPARLSYAQDWAELMRSGIVDQMSFAFRIGSESMTTTTDSEGYETDHFRILEVSDLFDVCVCPQGAYSTTDAVLHARIASTGRAVDPAGSPNRKVEPFHSAGPDARNLEPSESAGEVENAGTRRRLTLLRMKAAQQLPNSEGDAES